MPQELVEPEQFLERLTAAFSGPSSSETIWLSHKRYTYDEGDANMSSEDDEHDVLIRCTQGEVAKFSAKIPASRLIEFHTKYGSLLKSSLAPHMRKRDKKKEKSRAESKEKTKREAYVDVVLKGAKRGAGHRQRVKAQKKKEADRERFEAKEAKAAETAR